MGNIYDALYGGKEADHQGEQQNSDVEKQASQRKKPLDGLDRKALLQDAFIRTPVNEPAPRPLAYEDEYSDSADPTEQRYEDEPLMTYRHHSVVSPELFKVLDDDYPKNRAWSRELKKTAVTMDQLLESHSDNGKIIMITGAATDEGKPVVPKNLGTVLSAIYHSAKILIMDFNPIERSDDESEFVDTLREATSLTQASELLEAVPDVDVITVDVGMDIESCRELNFSVDLQNFIEDARNHFDIILFDTPPYNQFPVCDRLGRIADGVALVVPCSNARIPSLDAIKVDMEQLGINLMGVILNHREHPLPLWLMRLL